MSFSLIRQARQLLTQESGTIYKPHAGKLKVALAYPNTYWVGMSNLGFQTIYHLLNQRPDTVCERVFLPSPAEWQAYKRSRTPLFSLESQTPIRQFDLLAFSVAFEGDYPHILDILELAGIDPRADQRTAYDPLLIMGGVCSFMNPEPLAPIMDGFVLGDGEEIISEIMDALGEVTSRRKNKAGHLRQLSSISGFYAPALYRADYNSDNIYRGIIPKTAGIDTQFKLRQLTDLSNWPTHSRLITPQTEFRNMFLVELSRGCAHSCRFCLLGSAMGGSYRPRSLEAVSSSIKSGLNAGRRIGLVGATITDYPYLNEVCRLIEKAGGQLSVASLRADNLSPDLLNALKQSGHKTITLAPEAGSQRLRDLIAKGLTETDILKAVEAIASNRIPHIKLYLMWGLPHEQPADIQAILQLAKKVRQIMSGFKASGQLTLSLSPFVPKPQTPFQWLGLESLTSLNRKLNYLRRELRAVKGVKLVAGSPRLAFYQALFSRGDRRLGEAMLAAYKEKKSWQVALKRMQPAADFFVHRQRKINEAFAWDHLTTPESKLKLQRAYERWRQMP